MTLRALAVATAMLLAATPTSAQKTWDFRLGAYPAGLAPDGDPRRVGDEALALKGSSGQRTFGAGSDSSPVSVYVKWQRGGKAPTSVEAFLQQIGPPGWVTPTILGSGETNVAGYRTFYRDAEGLQTNPNVIPQHHSVVRTAIVVLPDGGAFRLDVSASYFHATDASHRGQMKDLAASTVASVTVNGKGAPAQRPPPAPPAPQASTPEAGGTKAMFSMISGQVEVLREGETEWEPAKMDTELRPNDRVKTDMDSECIINLKDMTTLRLEPESEFMVLEDEPDDSKLKLVTGKIWANIKRMMKDGKLEIETTQAVAGIKGTTLTLATSPAASTLQVFEGTVEFRSKATGARVTVRSGETVTASARGMSPVTRFDVAAATAEWRGSGSGKNAATGVNLARGKPASASGSYASNVASRGNDGDLATIWNGGGHQACWKVDLQGVHPVQRVVVSSQQFGTGAAKTVFQVSSSLDGTSWTPVGPSYAGQGDQTFTISAKGSRMRHVRYCTIAGSTQWATLGELQVY